VTPAAVANEMIKQSSAVARASPDDAVKRPEVETAAKPSLNEVEPRNTGMG
jgi:hypothetical protein